MRWTAWEVGLLITGTLLTALVFTLVLLIALADAGLGRAVIEGIVTEVWTGREGGIPVALAGGVPPIMVFLFSVTQDLAAGFLVYPLVLHLLHRYHDRDNYVMERLRAIEEAAARKQHFVDRWGPLGIFLFMLVPFLVNGPLAGLLLGRLAGIRTRYLVVPVVAATVIAAALWTFSLDAMLNLAEGAVPGIGRRIAWTVAAVLAMLVLWDARRASKRRMRGKMEENEKVG